MAVNEDVGNDVADAATIHINIQAYIILHNSIDKTIIILILFQFPNWSWKWINIS